MEETITIDSPSKYGFKDTNGNFWSIKFGLDATGIKPGSTYAIEYVTSSTGKSKYITSYQDVNGSQGTVASTPTSNALPVTQTEQKAAPGGESPVKKATTWKKPYARKSDSPARDFDKEARGKTRCALYEAALSSPAIANLLGGGSLEDLKSLCREIAADGVDYTFDDETK